MLVLLGNFGDWADRISSYVASELAARPGMAPWLPFGWISFESGGKISDVTTGTVEGGEWSYFQLTRGDIAALGLDSERLLRDPEYAVYAGFLLMDKAAAEVSATIGSQNSDTYYRWVKYVHSIGSCGFAATVADIGAHGLDPWDWSGLRAYYSDRDNDLRVSSAIRVRCGNPHQPSNAIRRVDGAFDQGVEIAQRLGFNPYATGGASSNALKWAAGIAAITAVGVTGYYLWKRRPR